ncbi:subtilisin-like protein [Microthyrium microscopicum]|uniref:Subtilisin-like protein n=1 Tax=Microthyrium microscopicum TaxID=703497 RepID=A0A6A6UT97_9PEZI|nr:subtilisin-like protein [Microthyrium microscopicum]
MRSLLAYLALQATAFAAPVANTTQATSKYIVVLKPEHSIQSLGISKRGSLFESVDPFHTYDLGDFKGFAASLTATQVTGIKADSKVAYVEADGLFHIQDIASSPARQTTQSNSTWGLARISHRSLGPSDYIYDVTGGEGTCAYILDTGLEVTHPEFEGRATFVKTFDQGDGNDEDMHGHGTHVAGTIGSKSYGVAKKTKLFGMKVCNVSGSCTASGIAAAIIETVSDSKTRGCTNGVVINLSLGSSSTTWQSTKDAVKEATAAGVFVAVAAGNEDQDTANVAPANAPESCVAAATDETDQPADFSNWGHPVAVYAPGFKILSTWRGGSTNTISGTSMASPHLAGLGAYLLGLNGKMSPAALCSKIKDMATKDAVQKNKQDTNNLLIFNGEA